MLDFFLKEKLAFAYYVTLLLEKRDYGDFLTRLQRFIQRCG